MLICCEWVEIVLQVADTWIYANIRVLVSYSSLRCVVLMVGHELVTPNPDNVRAKGLYDPNFEHDACGVAWLATLTGEKRHDIVSKSLAALRNLDHRGASGSEVNSGDGAGILTQIPDDFFRNQVEFSFDCFL